MEQPQQQPQQPIDVAVLARLIREEVEKLGWTYRIASEKSVELATDLGWKRKWGEKNTVVGISNSAWQGLATARGIPDLEVLHLAVLTLRKHGSTLTFRRAFEAMGIPMDGDARGDSERRSRALAIVGSLSEEGQRALEEVLSLPPAKYRIVQALVAALRSMDETA